MNKSYFLKNNCWEEYKQGNTISLKGKFTKYILKLKTSGISYKVVIDGCLITGNVKRCDFAVLNFEKNNIKLIELKGHHLYTAIEQISSTIDIMKPNLGDSIVDVRIVLSKFRNPKLRNTPKYLTFIKRIKREYSGNIKIQSQTIIEEL